ncbi:MAG: hypothetical protein ABI672_07455 [Vicinamibacteria bacterium]
MNEKKPFTDPTVGEGVDLTSRDGNFPLMPLMGGGSLSPGDGPLPGSGADGSSDTLGGDGNAGGVMDSPGGTIDGDG